MPKIGRWLRASVKLAAQDSSFDSGPGAKCPIHVPDVRRGAVRWAVHEAAALFAADMENAC